MSLFIIVIKTPFLSNLLISLYYKSINRAFYIKTNIFINRAFYIKTNIFINRGCLINIFIKVI
jgi:hypothetical protein